MTGTLSPSESARLRAYLVARTDARARRDEAAILLMLDHGLRASEVARLTRGAIEGSNVIAPGRQLALDAHAEAVLLALPEQPDGRLLALTEQAIAKLVKRCARAAGVHRDITPITLRRTFANEVFPARIGSLRALARVLGLGSTITAARYLDNDLVGAA